MAVCSDGTKASDVPNAAGSDPGSTSIQKLPSARMKVSQTSRHPGPATQVRTCCVSNPRFKMAGHERQGGWGVTLKKGPV